MKALLPVLRLLLSASPRAMVRGAALSVIVLLMGSALLGLSGWFITATGLAGMAGIGIAFDVFRPSAGVRFLALGRTVARYGERLLTHDATLRALATLRVSLLKRQTRLGNRALARLRGEAILTRIISDVDALDGVVLRLALPGLAGLITHLLVFAVLGWLASWWVAWALLAGYVPLALLILWMLARRTIVPADDAEAEAQALRRSLIDMLRDRQSQILDAALTTSEARLIETDVRARRATRSLDRAERRAGAAISMLVAAVTGLALAVGGWLVAQEVVGPAAAAIGIFVALALAETLMPLKRGISDYGRMAGAARRIAPDATPPADIAIKDAAGVESAPLLAIHTPALSLEMTTGDSVALTGPSGSGKSTLLMQIAALEESNGIALLGVKPTDWLESALRERVTVVPQRSVLMAGTIRDNLRLASDASDAEMLDALDAVALSAVIDERGGLDARLGEGGSGLSGGQARRLTLARGILRRPRLLLLDEPTEGLDADTAHHVLSGIRAFLPETAIIATLHRSANHPVFNRQVTLAL